MNFAIETSALAKKFGAITAVNSLNLQVAEGIIFGLIGPDGAGKTTTMRMLCSVLTPDSGTARVGGWDVVEESEEVKKLIGYMPQRFSLYGDLTVMENLEFYAEIYQVPKKTGREKMKELLHFSSLTEHAYKLADQLSGGMKQKLALACNLIHTPRYLFLDEPTIGVDPVARKELWNILFDIKKQGVTIFVSTPYMDEAERCDEIGLMHDGQIIRTDNPTGIIESFERKLLCVFTDDNYRAKDVANASDYVLDAYLLGDELHIVVEELEIASKKLQGEFETQGLKVAEMKQIKPSFEDVFVNIIKATS